MTIGIIIQETPHRTWISVSNDCETTANMLRYYSSEDFITCHIIECKYEHIAYKIWALIDEKYGNNIERGNWYRLTHFDQVVETYMCIADQMVMAEDASKCTKRSISSSSDSSDSSSSSSDSSETTTEMLSPVLKRAKATFP